MAPSSPRLELTQQIPKASIQNSLPEAVSSPLNSLGLYTGQAEVQGIEYPLEAKLRERPKGIGILMPQIIFPQRDDSQARSPLPPRAPSGNEAQLPAVS